MTRSKKLQLATVALASALALGGAQAAAIVKDNSNVNTIPGLTGFSTTGAMMTGLSVTANFSGNFSQTLLWSTFTPTSGGVTGTGWGLSLNGDSFTNSWIFSIGANTGRLLSFVLDGTNALTVLDTTTPSPGTPDSAAGLDFDIVGNAALNAAATGTYTRVVRVGANAPVGDLYQMLTVTFANNDAPRTTFSFNQDTDNDARFTVPEPGSLALAGLALIALARAGRRRA